MAIDPPETIVTSKESVACDGGGGALGHPMVYLHMKDGQVECPYCDRLFIYEPKDQYSIG